MYVARWSGIPGDGRASCTPVGLWFLETTMLAYSTVNGRINKLLRENDWRLPTPKGCYVHNNGYSFKYAKLDALMPLRQLLRELGNPDFVSEHVDHTKGLLTITMHPGSDP